jgi:hypothetical protein
MSREEKAASKAIGARANLLRDTAALKAARVKYSSLAELLGDANSDHSQVEETLSKIASNIHTWKDLRRADEKDVEKRAKVYKAMRRVVAKRSITLAHDSDSDKVAVLSDRFDSGSKDTGGSMEDSDTADSEKDDASLQGESLLQVRAGAGYSWWSQRPVELEQELEKLQQQGAPMYAYVPQGQVVGGQQQMAYVPAQVFNLSFSLSFSLWQIFSLSLSLSLSISLWLSLSLSISLTSSSSSLPSKAYLVCTCVCYGVCGCAAGAFEVTS